MSVRVLAFNAVDGSWMVVFDETGHTGKVPPANITFYQRPDGSLDLRMLVVPCPDGCGAMSTHPIADGASAAATQELFVRLVARAGCPCGALKAGVPMALAVGHARLEVQRTAGSGRWEAGAIS